MRTVLIAALKDLIEEDFELNDIVYQQVNADNIKVILNDLGFTRVSVVGTSSSVVPKNETKITDRFIFIDIDNGRFFPASSVKEVNGDYVVLTGTVDNIPMVTYVKPTGPNRKLTKGLRKKVISAMK